MIYLYLCNAPHPFLEPPTQALAHPRMSALLKSLDARVTDVRRGGDRKIRSQGGGKKRRRDGDGDGDGSEAPTTTRLARVRAKATSAYEGSSVFLDSLSGFVPERSLHHHRGRVRFLIEIYVEVLWVHVRSLNN